LGVVAELTLKVVPAHKLVEKTFVSTRNEIEQNHMDWVKKHQHLRYMWIPHTENVVVVCSDPEGTAQADNTLKWLNEKKAAKTADAETEAESDLERLSAPYQAIFEARGIAMPEEYSTAIQLRDHLYNLDPLNTDFVKEINAASAEFWKRNEGVRVDWSDQILGFDCGGEQWVDESCFKVPELSPGADADSKELPTDLKHTEAILSLISSESLPAHEPIEQRWSLGTASPISPSFAKDASVFSWVGIIMYLPPASDPANTVKRHLVTAAFEDYVRKVYAETKTSDPSTHLAKIEFKEDNMDEWRERFRRRMGDENWARLVEFKRKSDPNGILSNDAVAKLIR
jgi:L-galactono-1,4-lactone dehydrogenase